MGKIGMGTAPALGAIYGRRMFLGFTCVDTRLIQYVNGRVTFASPCPGLMVQARLRGSAETPECLQIRIACWYEGAYDDSARSSCTKAPHTFLLHI